ncbi:MAG: RNA polymerase sigma factor [Solirubrobacteraceae bacterium]
MTAAPLSSLTDEQLVSRFRAGDDAAFTEIHRRYRPALTAFAARMLRGTGHDADDVVQESFIRAFRGLRATCGEMTLRAWLYMIVRNRTLDELRAPRRAQGYDDGAQMDAIVGDDPVDTLSGRDELARIVAEIGRLPRRQRMALVLREVDGRSHAETARALETTVPATKSLVIRARSNLRSALRAA